jgi:prolyl-tRNA synthetase
MRTAKTLEDFANICEKKHGFIKAMWCGDLQCEEKLKKRFSVTSRCMPLEQEFFSDVCAVCGEKAKKSVYWGKAY